MNTLCDWLWSIHLPRTAVMRRQCRGSTSNAVRYLARSGAGIDAIACTLPSWNLSSSNR